MEGSSQLWHDSRRVCGQWRRYEVEFFLVQPLHCFGLKVQSFWWALSWWSVQFGQFLVCCSSAHGVPVPYGVSATICGHALHGSDKSLTLTALTRLFGSGLPHTLVLFFNPYPPNFLLKTCRICIILKTGRPGAGWGQLPPFPPPPGTTLMNGTYSI